MKYEKELDEIFECLYESDMTDSEKKMTKKVYLKNMNESEISLDAKIDKMVANGTPLEKVIGGYKESFKILKGRYIVRRTK